MRDRLVAIVGVSMALTPLLLIVVSRLLPEAASKPSSRPLDDMRDHQPQVLIAGFGASGRSWRDC